MLLDSNLLIYATQPEHNALRRWIVQTLPKVSVISKVEMLGYHRLRSKEQIALEALLDTLEIIYPSPVTFEIAIRLRQRRKLSLGDALIAATYIEHGLTLATHNTTDFDWPNEGEHQTRALQGYLFPPTDYDHKAQDQPIPVKLMRFSFACSAAGRSSNRAKLISSTFSKFRASSADLPNSIKSSAWE